MDHLDIEIPLSCIARVYLSPWLPPAQYPNLKEWLGSIDGCSKLRIARSTLTKNEKWYDWGKSATLQPRSARSKRKRGTV